MNNIQSKTLAQLVNANYRAATVFEKYKLDFCCRGKRTLLQACVELNLPVEAVERELELVTNNEQQSTSVNALSLSKLSDHIVATHHAFVKNETPSIRHYLNKILTKHGDRHPELKILAETFNELSLEMSTHMEKEEQVVFPLLKEYENNKNEQHDERKRLNSLSSPISMMEDEHDHAGRLLDKIRLLTANFTPPADACTTYKLAFSSLHAFQTDLHLHVHLENNILFPKAMKLHEDRKNAMLN
jgi:regulator of cell morphogenesis and NO signaling